MGKNGSHTVHKGRTQAKSSISKVVPMDVPPVNSAAPLGTQELALLRALIDCSGRVVGRRELARLAGMSALHERRCDSLLVSIRKTLGSDSIRTVRGRGWILNVDNLEQATVLVAA